MCPVCGMLHLEPLMMGIMVPETCLANNKFCNKEPSVASSWPFISAYCPQYMLYLIHMPFEFSLSSTFHVTVTW